jgi:hypothetical protein
MGHALAEGARKVALHPEKLPFGEQVNGLEVVLKRCIYTPTDGFSKKPVARSAGARSASRCSKAWKSGRRG